MAKQIGTLKLHKNVIYHLKQKQNKKHSKDVFSTKMFWSFSEYCETKHLALEINTTN